MNTEFKFAGEFLMAGNKCQPTFIMQGLITAYISEKTTVWK